MSFQLFCYDSYCQMTRKIYHNQFAKTLSDISACFKRSYLHIRCTTMTWQNVNIISKEEDITCIQYIFFTENGIEMSKDRLHVQNYD